MHVQLRVSDDVSLDRSKSEGRKEIRFNNMPFSVKETNVLDCRFGHKHYKQKLKQGKRCGCKAPERDVWHTLR